MEFKIDSEMIFGNINSATDNGPNGNFPPENRVRLRGQLTGQPFTERICTFLPDMTEMCD